jgi:hypothetical protein
MNKTVGFALFGFLLLYLAYNGTLQQPHNLVAGVFAGPAGGGGGGSAADPCQASLDKLVSCGLVPARRSGRWLEQCNEARMEEPGEFQAVTGAILNADCQTLKHLDL